MISRNRIRQSATNIADKKKWVINMSSRQLTHIETDLLAKGLNFSITSKTLPNKDIIATIEDAVKDLEKEEADTIRAKVSLTLLNSKLPKDNLSKDERKFLLVNRQAKIFLRMIFLVEIKKKVVEKKTLRRKYVD